MSQLETWSSGAASFDEPRRWRGALVFAQPRRAREWVKESLPATARAFFAAAMLAGCFAIAAKF